MIPNVRAKGKASVRVADILNRMQAEEPVNSSDVITHHFVFFFKLTSIVEEQTKAELLNLF